MSPCLLVSLSLCLAGCDLNLPGRPNRAERPLPVDKIMDFDTLYQTNCAGCHGANGKLGPAPPLNDALFLAIVPDADVVRTIREGRAVTATQTSLMPAFGLGSEMPITDKTLTVPRQQSRLTAAQIDVLAKGIKEHWMPPGTEAEGAPPYVAPARAGNKDDGLKIFAHACAGCHGNDGQGRKDDAGAIHNAAFLALISDQALRRLIITGRPDLGMPPYNGTAGRSKDFRPLTSAEINDLVALLAYWRQGGSTNGH